MPLDVPAPHVVDLSPDDLRYVTGRVPWWAVGILPLRKPHEIEVRNRCEAGGEVGVMLDPVAAPIWMSLVDRAKRLAEKKNLNAWRQLCFDDRQDGTFERGGDVAQLVRGACLRSERAFIDFVGLMDDERRPIVLDGFQVAVLRAMRRSHPACIILPLEHGKSYLSSIVVPLMDWAEWPDSSNCRVYWNDSNAKKWSLRLRYIVEFSKELHMIFPWIRRPVPGDPSQQWSESGFAIGGRTLPDRSWEPLTARGFSIGNRYSRIGADDWVNRGNCRSVPQQEKLEEHFRTSTMSMAQDLTRISPYGTAWPSVFLCGTFFDKRDVNVLTYNDFRQHGYNALRYDVYPRGEEFRDVVLWQEGKTPQKVDAMRERLGEVAFRLRVRNLIIEEGQETFLDSDLAKAKIEEFKYGEIPRAARSVISLDPASGSRSRHAANPALVLMSVISEKMETLPGPFTSIEKPEVPIEHHTYHLVKFQRLIGYDFPRQCATAIAWAREYNLPIVVESNTLQRAYADYISRVAPEIRVYKHHTGSNVMDADDGIETFGPLFRYGRVVIHSGDAPREELKALTDELLDWPQSRYKDLIMAFWFAKVWLDNHRRRTMRANVVHRTLPPWIDPLDYAFGFG